MTIGSELKEILDKEGMTAYRLAMELDLTQGYLSRLFKDRFNPSYGLVKKIAEVLGYDLRLVKKESRTKGGKKSKSRRSAGERRANYYGSIQKKN